MGIYFDLYFVTGDLVTFLHRPWKCIWNPPESFLVSVKFPEDAKKATELFIEGKLQISSVQIRGENCPCIVYESEKTERNTKEIWARLASEGNDLKTRFPSHFYLVIHDKYKFIAKPEDCVWEPPDQVLVYAVNDFQALEGANYFRQGKLEIGEVQLSESLVVPAVIYEGEKTKKMINATEDAKLVTP